MAVSCEPIERTARIRVGQLIGQRRKLLARTALVHQVTSQYPAFSTARSRYARVPGVSVALQHFELHAATDHQLNRVAGARTRAQRDFEFVGYPGRRAVRQWTPE